jgi:hypothetical protein
MKTVSEKIYSKKCTKETLYNNYFTVINGLLNLTKKEIAIVSRLYYYDHIISKSVSDAKLRGVLLFSPEKKSEIVKDLKIKPLLLNNYIASLKKKGIILVEGAIRWLNPKFIVDIDKDVAKIVFNLNIEEPEVIIPPIQIEDISNERQEPKEEQVEESSEQAD